jgi:uncharacterized protein (DUF58 family)
MSRTLFLAPLILVLFLAALATLDGALFALTIPLWLFWAHGLWRGPNEILLDVRRELSAERVAPQTPVTVKVTVNNHGNDLEELALQDIIPSALEVVTGSNHHLISLPSGESHEFEYTVRGPRGVFPFEVLHAEAGDHLGIWRAANDTKTSGQLLVFPPIPRIRRMAIRPRRTRVYAGQIPARVGGEGVEFFAVRDFEPGDSPGRINWNVSARHVDKLYSNEFQQERVADVGIVLDGRERTNLFAGGHSLFEYSVLAAGATADALLRQGNRVGLLVYSQYLQWTLPGYGRLQGQRILHALSGAAPGASQIFEGLQYLPARLFPPESQVVLISPLVEDDYPTLVQLRARGYQLTVVSPDPVAFEKSHLPARAAKYSTEVDLAARIIRIERAWMLWRVRRAGVHVVEWDVSEPFDQVTRRAFRRDAPIWNRL